MRNISLLLISDLHSDSPELDDESYCSPLTTVTSPGWVPGSQQSTGEEIPKKD